MSNLIKFITMSVLLLAMNLSAQTFYYYNNTASLNKAKNKVEGFAPSAVGDEWPCGAEGSTLTCTMGENWTLTVSGTGRMTDYDDSPGVGPGIMPKVAPWGTLNKAIIGNGVTYIGKNALSGNPLATFVVTVSAETPPTVGGNPFGTAILSSAILRVPPSSVDTYKNAPVWKDFGSFNKYEVTFSSQGG